MVTDLSCGVMEPKIRVPIDNNSAKPVTPKIKNFEPQSRIGR